jgi:hypothetical protein
MQQINLYQPILRKQKKVFSARTMLLGNLLILAGLLLLYGYTHLQTRSLQNQYAQASAQRDASQTQLLQMQQQYPPRQADLRLPAQLEAARNELRQQQVLLQAIRRYEHTGEQAFSAQLRGLAQQVPSGLWLNQIQLQAGQIHLQGQTLDAQQVPVLVQALSREAAFAGIRFEQVRIARDPDSGQIHFQLNTQRDPAASQTGIRR